MTGPLKFTNAETERQTYVSAFTSTLIDMSDGNMDINKAIDMLRRYGYEKNHIVLYVDDAFKTFKEIEKSWGKTRTI